MNLSHRYELHEPLGSGGMSVVWQAYDGVLEREVAVKLLNESVEPRLRVALRAEARAAASLNHPAIAQVYDYGEADDMPYLVMELVNGRSVDQWLQDGGRLPWRQAASICADLADALAVMHARGLVHRDVKPANVIITESGPKLVDFGICAPVGAADGEDGRLVGTPAFVAPERIADAPVGPAADVYSLGMLFYRMVAGSFPWHADSTTQLLSAHVFGKPQAISVDGLPDEIATTLMACLAKNPEARPSAAQLAAALNRANDDPAKSDATMLEVPTERVRATTYAASAAVAPASGRPRRPAARIIAVAGTFALALGLLGMLWSGQGTPRTISAAPAPGAPNPFCDASFSVDRDWGHGFNATVTVHNGSADLHTWSVLFAFPGTQRLESTRSAAVLTEPSSTAQHATATLRQIGHRVEAQVHDLPLAPGGTVKLSVHGSYRDRNPLPTVISLGGKNCETQVAGASTVPTPAATQPATGSDRGGSNGTKGKAHGKAKGNRSGGKDN